MKSWELGNCRVIDTSFQVTSAPPLTPIQSGSRGLNYKRNGDSTQEARPGWQIKLRQASQLIRFADTIRNGRMPPGTSRKYSAH
ncbi:hypothetical protein HN011_003393, partial [Eciton burchellii]